MPLTHSLSMQIYSARNFPPVEEQLAIIARHGFTNIETFGPFHDDPGATRRLLDAHRLTARSGHFSFDLAENHFARTVEAAKTIGMDIVVAPFLTPEQRPTDRAGWEAIGVRLARLAERFDSQGLRFAWHNHDFEFIALPDGSLPIEHILGMHLLFEADIAWIVRAGADPKRIIEKYSSRIPLVHVKDIAPAGAHADEDGWADVGAGVMDWSDLWARCVGAGAEIMVAEHDNPNSFDRFARVSGEAMRGYAKGGKR